MTHDVAMRRRVGLRRRVFGGLLAFGVAVSASRAEADERVFGGSWRRSAGEHTSRQKPAKTGFAAELRVGRYVPRVDSEFGTAKPYEQVFGESAQVYSGLELDWQLVRIPFLGTLGPGVGWGYTRRSAKAMISGTTTRSGQSTSLTIMPMHLSGVLRLDELYERFGMPLVPYGKLGAGVGLWNVGGSSGTASVDGVTAKGSSWGRQWAVGAMLGLDGLDRSAALDGRQATGVRHTYLFGEWMDARLGTGSQMRVGSSSWVTGLALEF